METISASSTFRLTTCNTIIHMFQVSYFILVVQCNFDSCLNIFLILLPFRYRLSSSESFLEWSRNNFYFCYFSWIKTILILNNNKFIHFLSFRAILFAQLRTFSFECQNCTCTAFVQFKNFNVILTLDRFRFHLIFPFIFRLFTVFFAFSLCSLRFSFWISYSFFQCEMMWYNFQQFRVSSDSFYFSIGKS